MKALVYTGHPASTANMLPDIVKRWKEGLESIPEIESYRLNDSYRVSSKQIADSIEDEEVLIGYYVDETINEEFFTAHPSVKYIASLAMGYGAYDRDAVKRHNVTLTTTVYGAMTIAQFTFALLLDICHNIRETSDFTKKAPDSVLSSGFMFNPICPQIELYGKTIGIIGLGHVGVWVARMAKGFGMKVIAHSRHIKTGSEYEGIEQVSLDELLARSDVISLNCSSNSSTYHLVNKDSISKMKDGVIILNPSRADLVNEDDLAEALNSKKVYAAGLDATTADNEHKHIKLMDCQNAIITPHIAYAPHDAQLRLVDVAIENLKSWINGEPASTLPV